jgi:hypothetical protein
MTKPKIVFTPGCFDDFEGTQEELDQLVLYLRSMVEKEFMDQIQDRSDSDTDLEHEPLPPRVLH